MKKLLLTLLLLSCQEPKKTEIIKETEFSFMTYNVLWEPFYISKPRYVELVKNIFSIKPDILILQEAGDELVYLINKEGYYNHTPLYKNIILYTKFEILDHTFYDLPMNDYKAFMVAKLKVKDKVIYIANTHLSPELLESKSREMQLTFINRVLKNKEPLVFGGDLNCQIDEENEGNFISKLYTDIWQSLKKDKLGYTYDGDHNQLANKIKYKYEQPRRIDVILTKNIKGRDIEVFPWATSDHFPVFAQLSF